MPPLYITVMALYTILTAYVLYLVMANMFESKSIWEQIMAVMIIIPFAMRLFFIK
jgi:hypothetical protein